MKLRIDSLAFGGDAVGRVDSTEDHGMVVFVPGGAPGDLVEVEVTERHRGFLRAEVVSIVEAGPARLVPPCPIATECGGCPWQHVSLAAQRAAKQEIVRRALEKFGGEILPIIGATADLGYRTRTKMTYRNGAFGYLARKSHEVVAVDSCIALDPRLDGALRERRASLAAKVKDGGTLAALINVRGEVATFSEELDVGDDDVPHVTAADGFQQANAAQNVTLRQIVRAAVQPDGKNVLELHAGDGNFSRDLAAAASLTCVESDAKAAARLRRNLGNHAHVFVEAADRAAKRFASNQRRFEVVLLDPPRAGDLALMEILPRLTPARIVYVSCDPMTLKRDLERLKGYRLVSAQPIDMMPHTSHIEVVCTLVLDAASTLADPVRSSALAK